MGFDAAPLLLALVPMIGWGAIQFFAQRLSHAIGFLRAGLLIQAGAFGGTLLLMPLLYAAPRTINWPGLTFMGVTGVLLYLVLYRALSSGAVSVVSPIVASWGLITALMGIALLHEKAGPLKIACLLGITAGLVALSLDWRALRGLTPRRLAPGAAPALLVALGWGITYFWLGPLTQEMGWYFTTLGTRTFTMLTFAPVLLIARAELRRPHQPVPWLLVTTMIVLDVAAFTTYNLALTRYEVSLVSIIASSSPLVSLLLARLLTHERLSAPQTAGAVAVIAGIIGLQV